MNTSRLDLRLTAVIFGTVLIEDLESAAVRLGLVDVAEYL